MSLSAGQRVDVHDDSTLRGTYGHEGDVCNGQAYTDASGNRYLNATQFTGPGGTGFFGGNPCGNAKVVGAGAPRPNSFVGLLLGQVGSSGWQELSGIGSVTAAAAGSLNLIYNDNDYSNNQGYYSVSYVIWAAATPTPVQPRGGGNPPPPAQCTSAALALVTPTNTIVGQAVTVGGSVTGSVATCPHPQYKFSAYPDNGSGAPNLAQEIVVSDWATPKAGSPVQLVLWFTAGVTPGTYFIVLQGRAQAGDTPVVSPNDPRKTVVQLSARTGGGPGNPTTFTVTTAVQGCGSVDAKLSTHAPNTNVSVTATAGNCNANIRSTFDHWQVVAPAGLTCTNGVSNPTCSFNMPQANVQLLAVFNTQLVSPNGILFATLECVSSATTTFGYTGSASITAGGVTQVPACLRAGRGGGQSMPLATVRFPVNSDGTGTYSVAIVGQSNQACDYTGSPNPPSGQLVPKTPIVVRCTVQAGFNNITQAAVLQVVLYSVSGADAPGGHPNVVVPCEIDSGGAFGGFIGADGKCQASG